MSIKIDIPAYLQPFTDNMEVVEVDGSTIGRCLDHLVKQFPGMEKMLLTKNSELFDYVSIFVNGGDAYPDELTKPVKDGDELHILYIIGGGQRENSKCQPVKDRVTLCRLPRLPYYAL